MSRKALNAFLAVILVFVTIDVLPQQPPALHRVISPLLIRLGISQGPWNLFAPEPDRTNARLSAEITYRDGEQRTWHGPDWSTASPWQKWAGHRHREWYDHIPNYKHDRLSEAWCRHIARAERPDLPDADRGAEVRLIIAEAPIPPAAERPWRSHREPQEFTDRWVLTIEQFE